jgi:hypothetical protein
MADIDSIWDTDEPEPEVDELAEALDDLQERFLSEEKRAQVADSLRAAAIAEREAEAAADPVDLGLVVDTDLADLQDALSKAEEAVQRQPGDTKAAEKRDLAALTLEIAQERGEFKAMSAADLDDRLHANAMRQEVLDNDLAAAPGPLHAAEVEKAMWEVHKDNARVNNEKAYRVQDASHSASLRSRAEAAALAIIAERDDRMLEAAGKRGKAALEDAKHQLSLTPPQARKEWDTLYKAQAKKLKDASLAGMVDAYAQLRERGSVKRVIQL